MKNNVDEVTPSRLIQYLDLTSLNVDDHESTIEALCKNALQYQVAAVCVFPQFVAQASSFLKKTTVQIATVANFPTGAEELSSVMSTIETAIDNGATEVDVVMPYQNFLQTQDAVAIKKFVQACKSILPKQCLKIILESGAFLQPQLLMQASLAALEGGADFLKTSTGKISQGASLASAKIMLEAILHFSDLKRGFKASGGVKHYAQAKDYYLLCQSVLGVDWLTPKTFRLGASSLLNELIQYG